MYKKIVSKCFRFILIFFIGVSLLSGQSKESGNKRILFLGNSITAGLGLNIENAYPALIQHNIDSLKLAYVCINGGLSGETTSGGLHRLDWMLKNPIHILVIALGGNDGLRGIPPDLSKQNLEQMVDKARQKYPEITIVIAGMEAPANMGEKFTSEFKSIFSEVAKKKKTALVPFLIDGVGGIADLNQTDQIHPNIKKKKKVAANVWKILKKLLIN